MKDGLRISRLLSVVVASLAVQPVQVIPAPAQQQKPNILLILGDNIGYGDIGAYGGGEHLPDWSGPSVEAKLVIADRFVVSHQVKRDQRSCHPAR